MAAPGALTTDRDRPGARERARGDDRPGDRRRTHGVVERFTPGQGWQREFLLTSNGSVSSPNLRAVAWPTPGRAFAVGDLGAMWVWQSATDLWEPDPAAPLDGFQGNLLGIAFSPSNPALGYAVGTQGTLLRYDKTWTQETLPSDVAGNNLTSVAFAGGQALVAAGSDLLENNGSGWTVDQGVARCSRRFRTKPSILAVAGLPDGGAVPPATTSCSNAIRCPRRGASPTSRSPTRPSSRRRRSGPARECRRSSRSSPRSSTRRASRRSSPTPIPRRR